MSRDYKALAQPYVGSVAEFQAILFPTRTATQLADAADTINTADKFQGKQVYETTNGFGYFADGPDPTDTWTLNDGLGATQVTPS